MSNEPEAPPLDSSAAPATDPPADVQAHQAVSTTAPTGLPSPNINHSASWAAERLMDLQRFQNGKAALEAERDGIQKQFEEEEVDRKNRHALRAADLADRIKDMDDGIAMVSAALDKADQLKKIAPQ